MAAHSKREREIGTAIGARVSARRMRLGLTQEELARTARMSRGFIAQIETGRSGVPLYAVERLARALRWRHSDLLRGVLR